MSQADEIELSKISGIGPKHQLALQKLGVKTIRDLVYYLPRRIVDLSKPLAIEKAKTQENSEVIIEASVKSISIVRTKFKKIWIVEAILEDETGAIKSLWFNQPYLVKFFSKNDKKYIFKGNIDNSDNKIVLNNPEIFQAKGLYPIYRQTKNLSSKIISKIIKKILSPGLLLEDLIPLEIQKKYHLPSLHEAAKSVHMPKTLKDFSIGKKRFLFEELYLFMLANLKIKLEFEKEESPEVSLSPKIDKIIERLPFKLTVDQGKALADVFHDFEKGYPMNRIIQGDVGSGKTIVAFLAAVQVVESGYQAIVLAPTEILSLQHHDTFKNLLEVLGLNIKVSILTSKNKSNCKESQIIIGTHAVFNQSFAKPGLIIIDEQQRFGVDQRSFLLETKGYMPHYLSLSATPIPRSLAHVIFSNCDISVIREKPVGRRGIKTYLIPETKRNSTYEFIYSLIKKGQQAFVICPLIYEGDFVNDSKSVNSQLKELQATSLGKTKIAGVHGKMKSAEKEKVMTDFRNKKIDVLVSTSIVEVGVDIPNATVMVIEDAQMFGLAQLHQFRGRIGRNDFESFCFLFAQINHDNSRKRLKAFVQNNDGFVLSEYDLKLRGPGSFFDINQSGFSGLNPLWFEDSKLLAECSSAAKLTLGSIEKFPALLDVIDEKIQVKHLD